MTVEVTGLASAQGRIAEIHARFGAAATTGTSTVGTSTVGTSPASTGSRAAGERFGAALADALARENAAPATAERPFLYDPYLAPGAARLKSGAAAALAAPPAPALTPAPAVTGAGAAPAVGGIAAAAGAEPVAAAVPAARVDALPSAPTVQRAGGTGTSAADALIATAKKYLGVPYKWGGTNPNVGLDCSGFVQLVFKQHGYSLPRVSQDQQRAGRPVDGLANARPGDLVTFGNPATHIGIYVGNGKMIHAPRAGDVVKIADVYRAPSSIRRILPDDATVRVASATQHSVGARVGAAAADALLARAAGDAFAGATGAAPAAAVAGGWTGTPAPDTWGAAATSAPAAGLAAALTDAGVSQGVSRAALPAAVAAPALSTSTITSIAAGGPLATAPAAYQELFRAAEAKHGVSAQLLAAVAKQESNFTPTAVSHAGARGLMQLMPGTARALGVTNSFDPAQAVDGAARLLRDHLRTFTTIPLALAAYNAGPGAVRRHGGIPPYSETQNYVRTIMRNLNGVAA